MNKLLLFIVCILTSIMMPAQSEQNDYIPFVKEGKQWHVIRSNFGEICHFDTYTMNEEVEKNGKTYLKMYLHEDLLDVVYDAGLLREEDRKVYMFDTDSQKEYLLFDYSLNVGDTYETYSYDEQKRVSYKVISVDDYREGPITQRRYLREWTVCRTDDESIQKIWIEGVGSLEGPLGNLRDVVLPGMCWDYLAYVVCNDEYFTYLPFSFCDTWNRQVHGCNLPKNEGSPLEDRDYQLAYELEGDRLHVFGKVALNCGSPNYAYFLEEPTDNPLVHKLHFKIQNVGPLATCLSLFTTDFYVPGFDPNINYIVVDDEDEEYPVINKTPQNEYRPFIEDGKVWSVRVYPEMSNNTWTEHYYFDGDTIIGGQTCKRMFYITNANEENWVNGVFTPASHTQHYLGSWYEQDKKVYFVNSNRQQFELLYDFTLSSGDSIFLICSTLVVEKVSGSIPGFKGTYYNFRLDWDNSGYVVERWLEGVGSDSCPWLSHPYDFEGNMGKLLSCSVGDEVIYYNSEEEDPYIMGARKGRFDFTHTIKTQPKAPIERGNSDACISSSEREVARPKVKAPIVRGNSDASISSSEREVARPKVKAPRREPSYSQDEGSQLYGEYSDLQLGIHLAPLDDAYQVSIADESGNVVYGKAVNAGTIVGLSIDISAYAEGRYTVTIENSRERFTGEFQTQATGISDATRLNDKGKKINDKPIYNLQGQRISSLQKGLNIVDGRKVHVR